jgi:hypothetical protein
MQSYHTKYQADWAALFFPLHPASMQWFAQQYLTTSYSPLQENINGYGKKPK